MIPDSEWDLFVVTDIGSHFCKLGPGYSNVGIGTGLGIGGTLEIGIGGLGGGIGFRGQSGKKFFIFILRSFK